MSTTAKRRRHDDRYIPSRSIDFGVSAYEMERADEDASAHGHAVRSYPSLCACTDTVRSHSVRDEYNRSLASSLFDAEPANRVLSFSSPRPSLPPSPIGADSLRTLYNLNRGRERQGSWRAGRYVPTSPVRILDAPGLVDDVRS